MYKLYPLFLRSLIALCALVALSTTVFAQGTKIELNAGREFHLGIPHCNKPATEGARGVPLQLWIGSKVDTKVFIEAPAIGLAKSVTVEAGKVKTVDIPEGLMNVQGEIARPYGIHVVSDEPITVTLYVSYKVSGEAMVAIPDEYLGKKYYALSMYQDATNTNDYKPGQILVVATQNNTKVSYLPPVPTEKTGANKWGSVTLQQGETFLIQSKIQPAYNQDYKTDLSGTLIEATKPIAVFSGHTKGAFPRFSATMLGISAAFMRNMMVDQMWPIEQLGTEYVSAPVQYIGRTPNGVDPDALGDLIVFVATQDNTNLYVNRPDGSAPKLVKSNMKKGEVYRILNQTEPAYFTTNFPVLAGQYGKAWRLTTPGPILTPEGGKVEKPANPSKNGEGMMFALVPRSAWSSYAIFRAPDGMNSFVNITFPTDQTEFIYFDKRTIRAAFGSKIQEIPGSPYSYIAAIISSGTHTIEADTAAKDAKFAAYVYGNYDATKDGFAYGYPVGVNYAAPGPPDSIRIEAKMECGNVTGKVEVIHPTEVYAGLHSIVLVKNESFNYILTTTPSPVELGSDKAEFKLTIIDPTQDAKGVINVIDRTGQVHTRTYEYSPEKIIVDQTAINFGSMPIGNKDCRQLTLTNPTQNDVEVKNVKFKFGRQEFTFTSNAFPTTIAAGQSITIEVCGQALAAGEAMDSIIAELKCYTTALTEVKLSAGAPVVTMNDLDFGQVPVGQVRSKVVTITNISKGNIEVKLDKVDWADKTHFSTNNFNTGTETLLDKLPIVLPKEGDKFEFTVYYKPDTKGVQDKTTAQFEGNTTVDKTWSEWKGIGIDAGLYIFGHDFGKNRINRNYDYKEGEFGISEGSNENIYVDDIVILEDNNYPGTHTAFGLNQTQIASFKGKIFYSTSPTDIVKNLEYTFNPKAEGTYQAIVKVYGRTVDGNKPVEAQDLLLGIGEAPEVDAIGYDFGRIKVNTTKDGEATIENVSGYDFEIENIRAQGGDAAQFVILDKYSDGRAFDATKPQTILAHTKLQVPVRFQPTVVNDVPGFTTDLEFDLVEKDVKGNPDPKLIGRSFSEGTPSAEIGKYDFRTIYTHTSSNEALYYNPTETGVVAIRNTGDVDGRITEWHIEGADDVNFTSAALDNEFIKAGETRNIAGIVFSNPLAVRSYAANVRVEILFEDGTKTSLVGTLTGSAKELPITVSVPKGYDINPGEEVMIDYNIRNNTAADPLTNAKLSHFHATVSYKNDVMRVGKPGEDVKNYIFLDNTLISSGWEVLSATLTILPGGMEQLEVDIINADGNSPIVLNGTNDQTLFRFKARGYIAVSRKTELPCNLNPVSREFLVIANEPGDLSIKEICVSDSRAIKKSGSFTLDNVAPNPVKDRTEITYSVAFEAQTKLVVVNSVGEEVAVLVNGVQQPGTYSVPFDVTQLATGTYFYRIISGPYSETKTLNVVK